LPPDTVKALRQATTLPPDTVKALRQATTLPPDTVKALHEATRLPRAEWQNFYATINPPMDAWRAALRAVTAEIDLSPSPPSGWHDAVDQVVTELDTAEVDAQASPDLGWILRLTYRQRILLLLALHPILEALAQFVEDLGGTTVPPAVRSGMTLVVATITALMLAQDFQDNDPGV
jgi:hypothetical protein